MVQGAWLGWGLMRCNGRVPRSRHKRTHWSRQPLQCEWGHDTSNPKPVTNILTTYYALQNNNRRRKLATNIKRQHLFMSLYKRSCICMYVYIYIKLLVGDLTIENLKVDKILMAVICSLCYKKCCKLSPEYTWRSAD